MNQWFETFAAEVAAGRRAVARDAAHAQWGAFGREDAYDVVALEIPFDGRDAHGEDARGLALRDGRGGPGVEVQGALGEAFAAGDPLLDPRSRSGSRFETRAYDVAVREDQIRQDIVAAGDEMRLLVVMPPRPREERAVSMYCERSRPGATRRMTCEAGSEGEPS